MTERSLLQGVEAGTAWARAWVAVIVVASLGALMAVALDLPAPIRPALTLGFLVVCPGMALVRLTGVGGPLTELMLAVALSLSLAGVVAGLLMYLGAWSPEASLVILIVVAWTALALDPAFGLRRRWAGLRMALAPETGVAASVVEPIDGLGTATTGQERPGDGRPATAPALLPSTPVPPAGGANPPPPPLAVVRRRAAPPVPKGKPSGRGRAVLGDDPFDDGQPGRALRNTIEQVVDDLADLRDRKRP